MPDLTQFIDEWGYAAIFLIVVLGNVGLPVPEETVLTVGGYLAWQGHLRLPVVVLVAIVSAVTGDNVGYWMGRSYGQRILDHLTAAAPERANHARAFILRHGAMGVFAARFVIGLRFMAGPLAGSAGLAPGRFFTANLLGAVVYAPIIVGAGYAVGYGLGDSIERLRRGGGRRRACRARRSRARRDRRVGRAGPAGSPPPRMTRSASGRSAMRTARIPRQSGPEPGDELIRLAR